MHGNKQTTPFYYSIHTNGSPNPDLAQLTFARRSRNVSATGDTAFCGGKTALLQIGQV